MNRAEREQLKGNLRGIIAGRCDAIGLDTPFQWIVDGIKQPELFFSSITSLLPTDAILYFEGGSIAPDVATFYEAHRAPNAVPVVCDTIFPTPDIYHVAFSSELATGLREFAATPPSQTLFDHIKAYRAGFALVHLSRCFRRLAADFGTHHGACCGGILSQPWRYLPV
jgi:hypothetical protein